MNIIIETPKTIYRREYKISDYLIDEVELRFELAAEQTQVHSTLKIRRHPESKTVNPELVLLGEGLTLQRIYLNQQLLTPNDYQLTAESLTLNNLPLQPFELIIENSIYPIKNTALEGLYLSNDLLCTQCEAQGFRRITYFLDRPDIMSRFTTTLIADKNLYPRLLSNGNLIASGELDHHRHWVTWQDPFAKPCYLFALVAGQLVVCEDQFTTNSGRTISLQIFVEAHDSDKCDHAMQSLKKAMIWDEQNYGREYDLDLYMIVAVSHFNMGAMENKGLNVFNSQFVLARPDTATDQDYAGIEGVIAHEYFHNWTGNRITCRDWFQLSLKEGFTVFRDQQFSADQQSAAVKRIDDVNLLRTRQFAEDASPMAHPVRPDSYIEISNFYTVTVYEKGAEVVRMLHTWLGAEGFRRGCDRYFAKFDGQAVTCDDFVQALAEANQMDLSLFQQWYSQSGTPILTIETDYDDAQQRLIVRLHQYNPPTLSQPVKPALPLPIKFAAFYPNGELAIAEQLLKFTEMTQEFIFETISEKPILSCLRGFSAPVKLILDYSLEELAFLFAHDNDSFNRWEAGQKLITRLIFDLVTDIQTHQPLVLNPIYIEAIRQILQQQKPDLAYTALLLTLPSLAYLTEQMKVVEVDKVYQAREFVRQQLAQQLQPLWLATYLEQNQDQTSAFTPIAAGRRRLKNSCLSYLASLSTTETEQLLLQQFQQSQTMTDQIAALEWIIESNHSQKVQCLQQFYQQWQQESLVIDKWFKLQAQASVAGTFATVQQLMNHPAFNLKLPNRVRALIGTFSQSNLLHYHAADGSGYQFLADRVIELNGLNPQIAARMLTPLTRWQRFDLARQQLMKIQLQRIMQTPNISNDVFEIASKSLS